VGLEWAKEHYQNHRRNRAKLFFKEKIRVLDRLVSTGGYTHLILAGSPQNMARLRNALPKRLTAKLVDTVVASGREPVVSVLEATIKSFVEKEERESQAMVERLHQRIKTNGLAVTGIEESFKALREGRAETLILTKSFHPGPGQFCMICGKAAAEDPNSSPLCSHCGKRLRKADIKEQLASMAVKTRCAIEVVNESDMLSSVGGVGCLLRYHS
jgi:peptide subunit release factor 1 (eRF1)